MSKNGTAERKLRDQHAPEDYPARAIMNDLKNHKNLKSNPEVCSLHIMSELLHFTRQDFLETRKKFKELRNQHSTHKLAEIHYKHTLDKLERRMLDCVENYMALRDDFIVQRECMAKQPASYSNKD